MSRDGRGRRARAARGAGGRARCGQGAAGCVRAGAAPEQAGAPDAGGPRLSDHDSRADGDGGVAASTPGAAGGHGVHRRLLEGYLLPARGRGLGLLAGQRPGCEEPAGPRQNRHPGLNLAGEGDRAGYVLAVAGASRADPPVARPDPLPPHPGRRPGPGDAAGGEAARGRSDQDLLGAHRGARGVRAGDDGSADRRQTRPAHAGPARAGTGEGEDRSAGGGAARVLHRPSRGDPADDAGQHRPHQRPDHRP